jgi:hypothetical protein
MLRLVLEHTMQTPLSIEEALGIAPGSHALELPEQIETAFHVDVWETLYRWVHGRFPETDLAALPRSVVVGQEALRALLQAEQARLKAIGLIGEELDEAISVSTEASGPRTLLEDRPLEGRWLVVRPN